MVASAAAGSAAGSGSASGIAAGAGMALNPIGSLIDYGLNAAAASKQHDRNKNWATRKYQYELIALEQAGIQPAYMFAGRNPNAGQIPSAKAHQQTTNMNPQNALLMQQMRNMQAEERLTNANSAKALTEARTNEARIRQLDQSVSESGARTTDLQESARGRRIQNDIEDWRNSLEREFGATGRIRELEARGLPSTLFQTLNRILYGVGTGEMRMPGSPAFTDMVNAKTPAEFAAANAQAQKELAQYLVEYQDLSRKNADEAAEWMLESIWDMVKSKIPFAGGNKAND